MKINGLELPAALEANLRNGDYKLSPDQTARRRTVLRWIKHPRVEFFDYENIVDANELWTSDAAEEFLGHPNLQFPPGTVDPKLTLAIGESEPEGPIALDYRTAEPRVIYFCDIDRVTYWVELSPTYEALMKTIGAA